MSSTDWPRVTIDDIKAPKARSIAIGPFGSRLKSDLYTPEGVPVLRGLNLMGKTYHLTGEFVYVTDETADGLLASNVRQGDLVFPHRGAIGEVGLIADGVAPRYLMSEPSWGSWRLG